MVAVTDLWSCPHPPPLLIFLDFYEVPSAHWSKESVMKPNLTETEGLQFTTDASINRGQKRENVSFWIRFVLTYMTWYSFRMLELSRLQLTPVTWTFHFPACSREIQALQLNLWSTIFSTTNSVCLLVATFSQLLFDLRLSCLPLCGSFSYDLRYRTFSLDVRTGYLQFFPRQVFFLFLTRRTSSLVRGGMSCAQPVYMHARVWRVP